MDLVPVAGEAPESTVDTTLRPLHPRLGGGPYNVAVALGRLGVPTRFLSRISTDPYGEALVRRLGASTVDISLVQRGAEPTTLAVVGLAADGSARYTFHVEGTADRLVADPGPLPPDTAAVSLGTLSLVLEPGASRYEAVLRRESAAGRLVALDPNVRAALIPDAAAYRRRFESWLPDVGVLKVSDDDAAWLSGETDVTAAARSWLRAGPSAVVLTMGGAGIRVLYGESAEVTVPAARVAVVDTIGAGDTVQAALLAWLHRHDALAPDRLRQVDADGWRAALTFAATASGITVSRAGAEPPFADELPD